MQTIFVITVCRNAESLIEGTIKSVLSQTYPNVKYLIIDGASTDGTFDIIKKYHDKLTYCVSEPDKGIYDAMNKGLARARELGDGWVNFMNAGDTFTDENVLEDIFGNENLYGITESHFVIGGHTNRVYKDRIEFMKVMPADVIPAFIPFSHQSCFMRLGSWTFDTTYKIAADYKVLYNIFFEKGASSIKTIDRIISNYEMDDSFTFKNQKKAKGEYLRIQSVHRSWFWWKEFIKWKLY